MASLGALAGAARAAASATAAAARGARQPRKMRRKNRCAAHGREGQCWVGHVAYMKAIRGGLEKETAEAKRNGTDSGPPTTREGKSTLKCPQSTPIKKATMATIVWPGTGNKRIHITCTKVQRGWSLAGKARRSEKVP
jgi:hypothetical protein